MANTEDDLIARIAIDGRKAIKEAQDVIRQIEGMFRRGKFEIGGSSILGGGSAGGGGTRGFRRGRGIADSVREQAFVLKRQAKELRDGLQNVISAEIDFDRQMERIRRGRENRSRVTSSRMRRSQRGEDFNPLMPFLAAGYGGSFKNPEMKKALAAFKRDQKEAAAARKQAQSQAEKDMADARRRGESAMRRDIAVGMRMQKDQEREEQRQQKVQKDRMTRGLRSMHYEIGLGQREQKSEERARKDRMTRGLRAMRHEIGMGQRISAEETRAEEKANREKSRSQNENIRRGLRGMHAEIGLGDKQRRLEERQQRKDDAAARKNSRDLERRMKEGGRSLQGMILNPTFRDYKTDVAAARSLQGRRLSIQEQARRSEGLSYRARRGGLPGRGFMGPMGPVPVEEMRQRGIAEMFHNAGVWRAKDMRDKNQFGKSSGKFGMGLYQVQQMFEDYQYAGIRGMSNNLAFMGAQVGGKAGWGIIGTAFALQLADLTYKMLGFADAEEQARKAGERLADNQLELVNIQAKAASAFASAQASSKIAFDTRFEGKDAKAAREKLTGAEGLIPMAAANVGVNAIAEDVRKNRDKYIESGYAANVSDYAGMSETIRQRKARLGEAEYVQSLLNKVAGQERALSGLIASKAADPLSPSTVEIQNEIERLQSAIPINKGSLKATLGSVMPEIGKQFDPKKSVTGQFYGLSAEAENLSETIGKIVDDSKAEIFKLESEFEMAKKRLSTIPDSEAVARQVLEKRLDGDKQAYDLSEDILKNAKEYSDERQRQVDLADQIEKNEKNIKGWDDQIAANAKERRRNVELISDAERSIEQSMRGQLSNAENMVDRLKARREAILGQKTRSSDSYASTAFDINRRRTRDFMQQAGAPEWMIQQRDDWMVANRVKSLRTSADAAGKAGDFDRQIEVLGQLQQLQLDMAGSDSRMGVAGGFFDASAQVQKEIEAAYQKQAQAVQNQQQAWQGVVTALQQAQAVKIDPLSPDAIPKMQQYLALAQQAAALLSAIDPAAGRQMNNALGGAGNDANNAANANAQWIKDYQQAQWDLFGGYSSGGSVPGRGKGDTVPAMLTPGEVIIKEPSVRKLGKNFLLEMNRTGQIPHFASGGEVPGNDGTWWSRSEISGTGMSNSAMRSMIIRMRKDREEKARLRREQIQAQREAVRQEMERRNAERAKNRMSGKDASAELQRRREASHRTETQAQKDQLAAMQQRRYESKMKAERYWNSPEGIAAKKRIEYQKSWRSEAAKDKLAAKKAKIAERRAEIAERRARRKPSYGGGYGGYSNYGGGYGGYGGGYTTAGSGYYGSSSGYYGADSAYEGMGSWYDGAGGIASWFPWGLVFQGMATDYTYYNTPRHKRWSSPTSRWWRPNSERFGGSRGMRKRGFHGFSSGGIVPAATGIANESPMTAILSMMTERMGMTSGGSITNYGSTTNNSNFKNLTINVQSAAAIQQVVDKVRQAQNYDRRRRGR